MTHICVKGKGVRFNRLFGCYKWAMSMSISVQALAVLYLHPNYIFVAPGYSLNDRTSAKLCARLQSFSLHEQIIEEVMGS